MLALTAVVLSLALFLYVREDLFMDLIGTIGDWVAAHLDLP
jgi:hypothetical protein